MSPKVGLIVVREVPTPVRLVVVVLVAMNLDTVFILGRILSGLTLAFRIEATDPLCKLPCMKQLLYPLTLEGLTRHWGAPKGP